ncbi:glyoxalase [Corynebacterium ulcerans]|uniref:VOC family protein n=1 Tax=Corynebacterium ulcerans TaxID=65058 RepID=UPI0013033B20|nr:VOC family protein [Corynebacterium ulcerans]MBL4943508.1 VOC family protein [Corynebacterium ulcerans]QGZ24714.1 glyoxalase [Corynebacterium ulcerans]QOE23427.1 VOC family protein [Corynebacterium ulcerans]
MNNREIVFIVFASNLDVSVPFYTKLLDLEVSFESPRYVTMDLASGVSLALWTGKCDSLTTAGTRTSEVCINLGGGEEEILSKYDEWTKKGISVLEEPYDDVFGKTFVVADPDGNRIRVAPID